jgi:hypothetical protein
MRSSISRSIANKCSNHVRSRILLMELLLEVELEAAGAGGHGTGAALQPSACAASDVGCR